MAIVKCVFIALMLQASMDGSNLMKMILRPTLWKLLFVIGMTKIILQLVSYQSLILMETR